MDFLKIAVIVLFVVLTILTVKIHPEIHQPMLIEDANFQLVRISDTIEKTPVTVVQTQPQTITQPVSKAVEVKVQEVAPQPQPVEAKPVKIKFPKKEVPVETQAPQESQMELLQKLLNTDIEDTKALQENAQKLAKTIQPQPAPQQTSTDPNPYITEREELIAWSKWRSNVHNQIMKDSDIGYAPYGVVFTFNFLVDKYGNVSNIKVESIPAQYMDIARNGVKPAISRLQKKAVLNFPKGTRRTSTVVNGSFSVGVQNVFSTPDQFRDFERVVH